MIKLDNETYKIEPINYFEIKSKKKQIVIGSSLRSGNNHIIRLEHKEFGKTKKWNTYTITREGIIYEHYDPIYYSDYLNNNKLNKQSISIVLENMGYLVKNDDGTFSNWINEKCDENLVVEKQWDIYKYWEQYTDVQIESCLQLCKYLSDKFKIKNRFIEFTTYHKDIANYNGVVYRSNCIIDTDDVNPLLDVKIKKIYSIY